MIRISINDFMERNCRDSYHKLLVFGVSKVGVEIYRLLSQRQINMVWVDPKYNFYKLYHLPTVSADEVEMSSIDAVVIAATQRLYYYEKLIGLAKENNIPIYLIECDSNSDLSDCCSSDIKYTDFPVVDSELNKVSPRTLLSDTRLDLIVKYIMCKEFFENSDITGVGEELYTKLVLWMNNGREYVRPMTTCSFFSDYQEKKGIHDFMTRFKDLANSIRQNGFDKKHFIPVSELNNPINGAHRIAVALNLDMDVYTKRYIGFGEPYFKITRDSLSTIGYSDNQIKLIINTYNKLMKKG